MSDGGTCPVNGCVRSIGTTREGVPMLMCGLHWRLVPIPLQQRVWRSFRQREREKARSELEAEYEQAARAYREARGAAIAAAAQAELAALRGAAAKEA